MVNRWCTEGGDSQLAEIYLWKCQRKMHEVYYHKTHKWHKWSSDLKARKVMTTVRTMHRLFHRLWLKFHCLVIVFDWDGRFKQWCINHPAKPTSNEFLWTFFHRRQGSGCITPQTRALAENILRVCIYWWCWDAGQWDACMEALS